MALDKNGSRLLPDKNNPGPETDFPDKRRSINRPAEGRIRPGTGLTAAYRLRGRRVRGLPPAFES